MKPVKTIFSLLLISFLSIAAVFSQGTGSVKGKVRSDSGNRIGGVKITARQDGEDLKSTRTNRKGEFRLRGLTPGTYNLVFEKRGFSGGVLYNVLVKKKKVNNLRDRLVMTVDQGTLVIINGSVFNQHGRSVPGAKIKIYRIRPGKSALKAGTFYSSRSGEFTFRFPEGKNKFRVTASAKGVTASEEIVVEEAAIYRLTITLNLPEKEN